MSKARYGEAMRGTLALFDGGAVAGLSDRELLARFVERDGVAAESAFAAIVARHGPMVLRVGSAVLRDEHAAHDALQATFLVLARRAGSLRVGESLAPWLHEVARRVASRARSDSARRLRHERRAAERSPRAVETSDPDDLAPAIHDEVARFVGGFRRISQEANARMAVIRVGHRVCGFSVPKGAWDVLDLGADTDDSFPLNDFWPLTTGGSVLTPKGDRLYMFNAAKARFQDIESDEEPAPADRPRP